jgi:hypothetical protein
MERWPFYSTFAVLLIAVPVVAAVVMEFASLARFERPPFRSEDVGSHAFSLVVTSFLVTELVYAFVFTEAEIAECY